MVLFCLNCEKNYVQEKYIHANVNVAMEKYTNAILKVLITCGIVCFYE